MRAAIAEIASERDGRDYEVLQYAATRLFDPARREHFPMRRAELITAASEQVGAARRGLLEEAFLLERLAENQRQHLRVPGVPHRGDARSPAIDERLRVSRVLLDDAARRVRSLA